MRIEDHWLYPIKHSMVRVEAKRGGLILAEFRGKPKEFDYIRDIISQRQNGVVTSYAEHADIHPLSARGKAPKELFVSITMHSGVSGNKKLVNMMLNS